MQQQGSAAGGNKQLSLLAIDGHGVHSLVAAQLDLLRVVMPDDKIVHVHNFVELFPQTKVLGMQEH